MGHHFEGLIPKPTLKSLGMVTPEEREARDRAFREKRETEKREAREELADSPTVEIPEALYDALLRSARLEEWQIDQRDWDIIDVWEEDQ